jgi:hypothetical protein
VPDSPSVERHSSGAFPKKMAVYFQYLDALHSLAASSGTPFHFLDRILYIFDKERNGTL